MASSQFHISPKYPVLVLAIASNALIFSFFFTSSVFSIVAGAGFGILVLMILGLLIEFLRRGTGKIPRFGFIDNLNLTTQYLRMNKRYIFTSIIGLIISILVISQTMIVVTSYQQYAFDQYIEGSDLSMISMSVENVNETYFQQWNTFVDTRIDDWIVQKNLPTSKVSTYQTLKPQIILAEQAGFSRYVDTQVVSTRNWDQESYNLLANLPSFPGFAFDPSEKILFIPSSLTRAAPEFGYITYDIINSATEIGEEYQFELLTGEDGLGLTSPEYFDNVTLNVDRIWKWTAQDISFLREQGVVFPLAWLTGTIFQSNEETSTLQTRLFASASENGHRPYIWGLIGFETRIYTEILPIDEYSLNELQSNIENFYSLLFDLSFEQISLMVVVDYDAIHLNERIQFVLTSPLEFVLENYLESDNNFISLMQFAITPLILISLFLFYFSLSIVEDRKIRYFKKLKGRGVSGTQTSISISGEILTYAIIAPLIALPLAVPLAELLLNNSTIFQNTVTGIPIRVPSDLYWKVSLLSLIFSLDFNLPLLLSTFTLSLDMNEREADSRSLLERGNYDLILLLFAFAYWIFVPYIEVSESLSSLVYEQLGYVALGMTLIASPIFVSRFLIGRLDRILSIFRSADSVTIAIRSIQLNKKFTQKLITLLIISTMFTYIGIVSSSTVVDVNDDLTHYQLGSDMYVEGVDPDDPNDWNKLKVEGVESISYITRMSFQANGIELRSGELKENAVTYEFIGVNASTLKDVLYWENHYANRSLETILDSIDESPTIGLQTLAAKGMGLSVGEKFQFLYGYRASRNYSLIVNTSFDFFPRLINSLPSAENVTDGRIKLVQILASNELVKDLGSTVSRRVYDGALIKLKLEADRDVIRKQYFDNFVHLSYLRIFTDEHDRVSMFNAQGTAGAVSPLAIYEEQFFQASLIMFLITSLVVTVMGMAYYSFVTITQRKREIGIYRSLGMVSNQLLRHLIIEILLIVITSITFSAIVGTYISGFLFRIMSGNVVQTIPPFQIEIPIIEIVRYTVIMIGSAILLTILPSFRLLDLKQGTF